MPTSITEQSNFLSADIDLASPTEIVRILREADSQTFSGYLGFPGLYDEETLSTLEQLALRAAQTLAKPRGRFILSGAGTSGRLAMFTTRMFNAMLGEDKLTFLMAGGLPALIQAQEGAEDDPQQGIRDLEVAARGASDVFYVGITCGLSAPYIAGQLQHLLAKPRGAFGVLLGFNPVEIARDTPIENWPRTFRDTAHPARAKNAAVLNPVIGPEPITGSTRMKGGSATNNLARNDLSAPPPHSMRCPNYAPPFAE